MADTDTRISELIWRTDNRTAIRGLKEIADQGNETKDSLKTDADEESASFDRVSESTGRLRDSMMGLAGMVGMGGVAFGLKDLLEGGEALQEQQAQLQAALRNTGANAAVADAHLEALADRMSTSGGFATTQNLQALTSFVQETHSASEAQKLLALSTNIARARNLDLATAQQAVATAYTGSVGRLQKLLGPMVASRAATIGLTTAHQEQIAALQDEAAMMGKMGGIWMRQQEINDHLTNQQVMLAQLSDKHATAQEALAAATREFGGATSAYADTTKGKITELDDSFHNLTEELGVSLLPSFNRLIGVGVRVSDWMEHNKTDVMLLVGAFGALGAALGIKEVVKAVHGLYDDVGALIKRMPIFGAASEEAGADAAAGGAIATASWRMFFTSTLIGLGLVALVEIATHWHQTGRIVVDVWDTITHAVSAAWGDIRRFVDHGVDFIWDKIKGLGDDVKHLFADSPLGGLFGFGENLLGGHVGRAFGALAQGDTFGAIQSGPGGVSVGTPFRNVIPGAGLHLFGGHAQIHPSNVALKVDGREVANAVIRYELNRAARGPSNMVGGSLVTGSPGIAPTPIAAR